MGFANRIYFNLQRYFIGYIDGDTGEINFTSSNSDSFPRNIYGSEYELGMVTKLPNGKVFVRTDVYFPPGSTSGTIYNLVIGFVLNANLDPGSAVPWYGGVEYDSGIRDARYSEAKASGGYAVGNEIYLQWTESHPDETPANTVAKYDMSGNIVAEYGDVHPTVASYIQDQGGNYEVHDGYFFRTANVSTEVHRVPLTPGSEGEFVVPIHRYGGSAFDFDLNNYGYLGHYDGLVWFLGWDKWGIWGPAGRRFYVVGIDPDELYWRPFGDNTPLGYQDVIDSFAKVYPLDTPIAPDDHQYNSGFIFVYGGFAVRQSNWVYFFAERAQGTSDEDWGTLDGGNGMGYGTAARLARINLDTGDREILYDVPFGYLNKEGDYVRADDDWYETTIDGYFGLSGQAIVIAGMGRAKINAGDDVDRDWKYLNPQPGENGGFGRAKVNIGTDEDRVWVYTSDLASGGTVNIGDDDNREWLPLSG